jgi:hypothetical protein
VYLCVPHVWGCEGLLLSVFTDVQVSGALAFNPTWPCMRLAWALHALHRGLAQALSHCGVSSWALHALHDSLAHVATGPAVHALGMHVWLPGLCACVYMYVAAILCGLFL